MTWDDCIAELCRARKMTFSGEKEYLIYYYEDLTYDGQSDEEYKKYRKKQSDIKYKMKPFLATRIAWLFPRMTEDLFLEYLNNSEDISEPEKNLFKCLCKLLPRYKKLPDKEENINLFDYLDEDMWEIIPHDDRMKILESVNKLAEDKEKIRKYLCCTLLSREEEQLEQAGFEPPEKMLLRQVQMKLQYPQYYRFTRNVIQLIDFFRSDYEDIIEKFGEENLFNFERDFSKLMKNYELLSSGYINTYLSEDCGWGEKIEDKLLENDEDAVTTALFLAKIQEGLRGRRARNTRRR